MQVNVNNGQLNFNILYLFSFDWDLKNCLFIIDDCLIKAAFKTVLTVHINYTGSSASNPLNFKGDWVHLVVFLPSILQGRQLL